MYLRKYRIDFFCDHEINVTMSESESPRLDNFNENNGSNQKYQTREEYMKELETWISQARMWQNISSCFPYYLMFSNALQVSTNSSTEGRSNQYPVQPVFPGLVPNEAYEFVIPPVWKRLVAEAVDFVILFVVKLALTLVALEVIDTSEWQFLKDDVLSNLADIHLGTEITTGILILEGIHRVVVCAYEVYWLRGSNDMRFGCATPGKSLVGITVIVATKVRPSEVRNNRPTILVFPAKNLGFFIAFGRSFVKNFILAIMFPFCFAFFIFQYNRTGYDIICNTVVVEYDPNPPKRNFVV